MSRIRVKHFGPIKEGYPDNEGWLEIRKTTVFIGNQGSGKSTIAKLISTLTWIEKALVRGDFKEKDLTIQNKFKKQFEYQNIRNYFKEATSIKYEGKAYNISFNSNKIILQKNDKEGYAFPKIMYVPSERNFISSVKNLRSLKGLPSTLYTFSDEFVAAIENLKSSIQLPVNNSRFEYQKLNKLSSIIGEDYKISLSESSSGFQSLVPLFIVSNYLANSLADEKDSTVKDISIEEGRRIQKEIERIYSNPNLSDAVIKASLEHLSSRFKYSRFVNIVEEPEQNLFPSSQRHILNKLLECVNMRAENMLILTTHSPYVINYLTLCVKANYVYEKLKLNKFKLSDPELLETNKIVPIGSTVKSDNLIIYQLDEVEGTISRLADYRGLPSDENQLNDNLEDSNELFTRLQEIEKGWL